MLVSPLAVYKAAVCLNQNLEVDVNKLLFLPESEFKLCEVDIASRMTDMQLPFSFRMVIKEPKGKQSSRFQILLPQQEGSTWQCE